MKLLEGRVVIVTGASTGIGRAAARLFAREGAKVVVGARRGGLLDDLVSEIADETGDVAAAVVGDVGEEATAARLVDTALGCFGRLDGAFNNAGTMGTPADSTGIAIDDWNEVVRTNLTAAFLAAKHQVPAMLDGGGGSIVFTSTFVGHTVGFPGMAPYAASKSGLLGLTRALATEYGPRNVRVNTLLPGGTDTPMGRAYADTPEALDAVAQMHALKRIADPIEIASAALFLLSDLSSFTTGTPLLVDGGVSVNRT